MSFPFNHIFRCFVCDRLTIKKGVNIKPYIITESKSDQKHNPDYNYDIDNGNDNKLHYEDDDEAGKMGSIQKLAKQSICPKGIKSSITLFW